MLVWVNDRKDKHRPWCLAQGKVDLSIWVPRTSEDPHWESRRWAVHSPAFEPKNLDRDGWFIVNDYVRKDIDYDPKGRNSGMLAEGKLAEIVENLKHVYAENRNR